MAVTLRRATLQDAAAFLEIKAQLHLSRQSSRSGGFLLGTTQERYSYFVEHDEVWVLEDTSITKVVGFAIVLGDKTLRESELWQKKDHAELRPELVAVLEAQKLSYYEQLACLPSYRSYGKYLAFRALSESLHHHQHLLTTVVRLPVHNRAALPFIDLVGFKKIGCIAEVYPEYGGVHSDIYHLSLGAFGKARQLPVVQAFIQKARRYNFL
jgi:ribosomal protein S18 acetylase RimI-like enzyme